MNSQSIEYVLNKMGVTEFKHNGDWVTASCPLAPWTHAGGLDRNPSFGVHEGTGVSGVHCFSCGFSGGMMQLVRKYGKHAVEDGLMTDEDVKQLIDFVLLAEDEDEVVSVPSVPGQVNVPQDLKSCLKRTHSYFEDRKIGEDTIEKWQLGCVVS